MTEPKFTGALGTVEQLDGVVLANYIMMPVSFLLARGLTTPEAMAEAFRIIVRDFPDADAFYRLLIVSKDGQEQIRKLVDDLGEAYLAKKAEDELAELAGVGDAEDSKPS